MVFGGAGGDAEGLGTIPFFQCCGLRDARRLGFSSKPSFLQESETAEPKLLNKPYRIQASRSGHSPLHPPQEYTEEKLL